MRSLLRRTTILALFLVIAALGCRPPDRGAGLYVQHPGLLGADLVTLHHGTFADRDANIRIRGQLLTEAGLAVADLEYPTSGSRNREIDGIIEEHAAFVERYLVEHPGTTVTFVGFSQGGCVELDMMVRLARRDPSLLDRSRALLVAPARDVKLGRSTSVGRRMITRCKLAEAELEAMATGEPEGSVARILAERTWVAWSCNDAIVGHDSFSSLAARIPAEHVLYREKFGHVPWVDKPQRARGAETGPYGDEVLLASALARALAEGQDLRAVLAAYGGADPACE